MNKKKPSPSTHLSLSAQRKLENKSKKLEVENKTLKKKLKKLENSSLSAENNKLEAALKPLQDGRNWKVAQIAAQLASAHEYKEYNNSESGFAVHVPELGVRYIEIVTRADKLLSIAENRDWWVDIRPFFRNNNLQTINAISTTLTKIGTPGHARSTIEASFDKLHAFISEIIENLRCENFDALAFSRYELYHIARKPFVPELIKEVAEIKGDTHEEIEREIKKQQAKLAIKKNKVNQKTWKEEILPGRLYCAEAEQAWLDYYIVSPLDSGLDFHYREILTHIQSHHDDVWLAPIWHSFRHLVLVKRHQLRSVLPLSYEY